MAMRWAALSLLLLATLSCSEDPVPKLEAERQALIERTRPKAEFWNEVNRKGELLKARKASDAELAELQGKASALDPELEQLAAAVAQAHDMNSQSEAALARDRTELARLEAEAAKRDAELAGFATRRAEP